MAGPKHAIVVQRSNLIITSPPFYPTASSTSATVRNYVAKSGGESDIAKVTVFDLANKLVSYSGTYREGVRDVFCQWSGVYVLAGNSKVLDIFVAIADGSSHDSTSTLQTPNSRCYIGVIYTPSP